VAAITDAEVADFLSEGTRTGKMAYTAADGRPLIAPVWFVLEDGQILFTTHKDTAKGRALARDPRVAMAVDLEAAPYAYVLVQGRAELSDDLAEVVRVATAVGGRYMGAERAEEFGQRNGVPGELLVRVTPTKVLANFDVTGH
jgi:PPOX class probable F420-dependent enzyme